MRPLALTFLAALVLVAGAAGSVKGSALNRTTFDDALGEDPAAPDIATVRVSNNDEGTLTFRIALPNRPTLANDMRFSLSIDADSNAETGLTGTGIDYRLLYDFYLHGDRLLWLLTCGPSVCTSGVKLPFTYESGPVVMIDRAELGNTRRFRLFLNAMDGIVFDPVAKTFDLSNAHGDAAPDASAPSPWTYDVKLGPSRLLVQRFSTTPAKPVAGKTFVAKLKVKRDDSGAFVTAGNVACKAIVGDTPARLLSRGFRQGSAFCAWRVPEGSSGKSLRGSIGVTLSGKTAKKAFALKVS
jgi:hypothetical protein